MEKQKPTFEQVARALELSADTQFTEQNLWLAIITQSVLDLKELKFKQINYETRTDKQIQKTLKNQQTEKFKNIRNIESSLRFYKSGWFKNCCENAGLNAEYALRLINTVIPQFKTT